MPLMTGGTLPLTTAILKLGSDVVALPSLTLMTIPEYVPVLVGVPVSLPLYLLKIAHDGLLIIENVNGSLLASEAVGANVYNWFAVKIVNGSPLMTGAVLAAAVTSVVNNSDDGSA